MAIGDTVQAGLMRIDTSAYERAGQANANANLAFGNALNQVAKGFIEGREKKARAEEMTGYLMNQGVAEKDAKAIAKNPFLQKEYQRKKGAEQQMEIEGNRLKMEAQKLAAQQRSSASQAFQKNREMDMKEELFRTQQNEIREDKQAISEANRLMRTRPQTETSEFSNLLEEFSPDQIPGTPEFEAKELSEPMGARPPLMASFATDKPNFEMFNVGKAPIEQQLPESFQGQAGRIIDMADNGEISPQAADLALNRIQAQAMAEQKAAPSLKDILDIQGKTQDIKFKNTDFEQEQDAISFKPEQNYLNLGEVKYGISGKFGNEAEVIKIKSEAIPNYQKMNEVMEDLIDLGEARKKQKYMSNSDKVLAESLSRQLQGLLREDILGPGTVTEPERAILEQIIQNPTQWFDFKGKTDDKIRSLKGVRKKAFNTLKSRLSGLGLDVSEFEQGGNASGTNKSSNMQNKTNSGLSFEEISLDDL